MKALIILDNGHGIDTAGKRSPDGRFREYLYARNMVKRLKTAFGNVGYDTYILVPEDKDISLPTRVARADAVYLQNKKYYDIILLLSIHCNAAPGNGWSNARGWAAYTSIGKTESDRICARLYDAAEVYLDSYKKNFKSPDKNQRPIRSTTDSSKGHEANFTIVKKTKCPAVLTENLFQNNREDVAYLLSEEGMQSIVKLHVAGVVAYVENLPSIPPIKTD